MRIASLVPSATEMLFALGLGEEVVAVTHECDFPPEAGRLPRLTRTVIPSGLDAAGVDAEVRRLTAEGRALYELDEEGLAAAEPDLVVTQAVCEVCAVAYDDVTAAAARLPGRPRVLSLDPTGLGDVLADVGRLADAAGVHGAGDALRRDLEGRLAAVRAAVEGSPRRRLLCLEWLDPPYVAGHWVPEMVALAGGEDVAGLARGRSAEASWETLRGLTPEVAVVMPCGYGVQEARREAERHRARLAELGAEVRAVDAGASFSRPGPRLADGVELLAHILHPERVDPPGTVAAAAVPA